MTEPAKATITLPKESDNMKTNKTLYALIVTLVLASMTLSGASAQGMDPVGDTVGGVESTAGADCTNAHTPQDRILCAATGVGHMANEHTKPYQDIVYGEIDWVNDVYFFVMWCLSTGQCDPAGLPDPGIT